MSDHRCKSVSAHKGFWFRARNWKLKAASRSEAYASITFKLRMLGSFGSGTESVTKKLVWKALCSQSSAMFLTWCSNYDFNPGIAAAKEFKSIPPSEDKNWLKLWKKQRRVAQQATSRQPPLTSSSSQSRVTGTASWPCRATGSGRPQAHLGLQAWKGNRHGDDLGGKLMRAIHDE